MNVQILVKLKDFESDFILFTLDLSCEIKIVLENVLYILQTLTIPLNCSFAAFYFAVQGKTFRFPSLETSHVRVPLFLIIWPQGAGGT